MKRHLILAMILTAIPASDVLAAQDAREIVRRLDANEVYDSLKAEAEFVIHFSGRRISKRFVMYARGNKDSYVEFTNREDLGTKFLKRDGNLFLYSPDAEEIIPITGHMLKESMMGSDLSYEDTVNNDTLESLYNASVVGEETLGGRPCWVLDLDGKRRTISYPRLKMWVDKENFIALKIERYALSGAILKEEVVLETRRIGKRIFPVKVEVRDLLRRDSRTVFTLTEVELDIPLSDSIFSMRNLRR